MFQDAGVQFHLFCFPEVQSSEDALKFIKEQHPEVCMIDAATIISPKQIQIAVLNAVGFQKAGSMGANNIYLEIMRCLSPNARLEGAFKHITFGKSTKHAIAITLDGMMPSIPGLGDPVDVAAFFEHVKPNIELVNKIFQVTEEMLKVYSYEEIIAATLAIACSNLIRTKTL